MTKFTEFYVHPSEVIADEVVRIYGPGPIKAPAQAEVVRICAEASEGEANAYRLAQAEELIRQFLQLK